MKRDINKVFLTLKLEFDTLEDALLAIAADRYATAKKDFPKFICFLIKILLSLSKSFK